MIFLADLREPPKSAIREELSRTFGKYIEQGFLIVIEAYPEYYPDLNNIKAKYGDSDSRRMWRSKANVDYAFVMCYCKDFSEYYIHLEDDVKSSPSFFPKLQDFIASQTNTQWTMLDVAVQGSIAKAYHSQDLENTASFFYIMYDEMPIDWLMERWRPIKDQGPYNNRPLASLFEHIGVKSTLAEKAPHGPGALEPFFDKYDHKYRGLNPPANVTSSLASNRGEPEDAYNKGSGYFWAMDPKGDDYFLIKFHTATAVQHVFVDTGSYQAGNDLLNDGVLQASFESAEESEAQLSSSDSCGNFETIGSFDGGKASLSLDESKKVICLRILVTQNQQARIFFREIDVWQAVQRVTGAKRSRVRIVRDGPQKLISRGTGTQN